MIKEIEGFEGYYIDDKGNVYSSKRGKTLYLLKPKKKNGWLFVRLHKGDGTTLFTGIHRLVAKAFIPTNDYNKEVNHKNYIRDDNRVENLEWLSHTDNVRYSRCQALRVIHDNGLVENYEGVVDFCKKNPNWTVSNIKKYIKLYGSYSKKHKLRFEYIESACCPRDDE